MSHVVCLCQPHIGIGMLQIYLANFLRAHLCRGSLPRRSIRLLAQRPARRFTGCQAVPQCPHLACLCSCAGLQLAQLLIKAGEASSLLLQVTVLASRSSYNSAVGYSSDWSDIGLEYSIHWLGC